MGYYTKYDLEIVKGKVDYDNIVKEIGEISQYGESCFEEDIKWYDHDKHMVTISQKYPNVIFKLMGEGEESDDSWHKYYHNGKMIKECRARIVFEEFDAEQYVRDNKLEELLK